MRNEEASGLTMLQKEKPSLEKLAELTELTINEIFQTASNMRHDHNSRMVRDQINRYGRDIQQAPNLTPKIIQSKSGRVYIYWSVWTGWRNGVAGRTRISRHLRRSGKYGYTENSLAKVAQDWELHHVLETEATFRKFRIQLEALHDLKSSLLHTCSILSTDT